MNVRDATPHPMALIATGVPDVRQSISGSKMTEACPGNADRGVWKRTVLAVSALAAAPEGPGGQCADG